jgi:hypothetical protein
MNNGPRLVAGARPPACKGGPMTATDRHEPGHEDPGADRGRALAAVDRDYPPWHAWPGVLAGVLYARRPNTSPPMVVRAITPDRLRHEIERAEHERGLRP